MAEKGRTAEGQSDGSGAGASAEDSGRSYIVVPMPNFLRQRFITEAKAADKPTGPYVRDLIAEKLGIELPPTTISRRSKYNSPEEAKAAQKAKAKERNELVKKLLEEHRARLSGGAPAAEGEAQEQAAA